MYGLKLSGDDLRKCLEALPPVDLLGLALLRQSQPLPAGSWVPSNLPAEAVARAAVQFVEYADRCAVAMERLTSLAPASVLLPITEFGL